MAQTNSSAGLARCTCRESYRIAHELFATCGSHHYSNVARHRLAEQRKHRDIQPDIIDWTAYAPPVVTGVVPFEGDANGGTTVTVVGTGFTAFSSSYSLRRQLLRCRFGGEVQYELPSYHNDTAIVCVTTWGAESPSGTLVTVSLDGVTFSSSSTARFYYIGLHKPSVLEAFFPEKLRRCKSFLTGKPQTVPE